MKYQVEELTDAKIIAKSFRKGFYFINPNFAYNGNRIAITTAIELKEKSKEIGGSDE